MKLNKLARRTASRETGKPEDYVSPKGEGNVSLEFFDVLVGLIVPFIRNLITACGERKGEMETDDPSNGFLLAVARPGFQTRRDVLRRAELKLRKEGVKGYWRRMRIAKDTLDDIRRLDREGAKELVLDALAPPPSEEEIVNNAVNNDDIDYSIPLPE